MSHMGGPTAKTPIGIRFQDVPRQSMEPDGTELNSFWLTTRASREHLLLATITLISANYFDPVTSKALKSHMTSRVSFMVFDLYALLIAVHLLAAK